MKPALQNEVQFIFIHSAWESGVNKILPEPAKVIIFPVSARISPEKNHKNRTYEVKNSVNCYLVKFRSWLGSSLQSPEFLMRLFESKRPTMGPMDFLQFLA